MVRIDQATKDSSLPDTMDLSLVTFALCETDGDARFLGRDEIASGSVLARQLDHYSIAFSDFSSDPSVG